MRITETCSCGASTTIEVSYDSDIATEAIEAWREEHRHDIREPCSECGRVRHLERYSGMCLECLNEPLEAPTPSELPTDGTIQVTLHPDDGSISFGSPFDEIRRLRTFLEPPGPNLVQGTCDIEVDDDVIRLSTKWISTDPASQGTTTNVTLDEIFGAGVSEGIILEVERSVEDD